MKEQILQKMEEANHKYTTERAQRVTSRKSTRFSSMSDWTWDTIFEEQYGITFTEVSKETAKMYDIVDDCDVLGVVTMHVICREVTLGEFPLAIEAKLSTTRKQALQAAVRISRHILKEISQHDAIGNVGAYIEEWKDEIGRL
jgi:hypothetical protein